MDFYRELTEVLAAFEAASLDYALCGGVALAIHGAPRATQDIDMLVRPEDMDDVRRVARSCGFTLESPPVEFASGVTVQRFTKLIEGQPFMVDALQVSAQLEAVWAGRLQASFEGGVVRVVSREGLISMKIAAGRSQDIADVQRLGELARHLPQRLIVAQLRAFAAQR